MPPRSTSRKTVLARMFDAATECVYALDGQGRIVYCNAALASRLHTDIDSLVGLTCKYSSQPPGNDNTSAVNGLAPPPDVWMGKSTTARVMLPSADGGGVEALAKYVPLHQAGSVHVVLAIVCEEPVATVAESPSLHDELRQIRSQLAAKYDMDQLVGSSSAIRRVFRLVKVAAQASENAVVIGPTGVGREVLAKAIHFGGVSGNLAPIVPLACQFLDAELLRTTVRSLLNHEMPKDGVAVPCLLLSDVDQLAEEAQFELLRLFSIETRRWRVLATARTSLIESGLSFVPDLGQQLSTIQIVVPPLAQRLEDVPLLAHRELERQRTELGKGLTGFRDSAMQLLLAHSWPGNHEELASVVAQACAATKSNEVGVDDLPRAMHHVVDAALHPPVVEQSIDLEELMRRVEAEVIRRSLRVAGSNKAHAARLLGVSRSKLLRRIGHLGIELSASEQPADDETDEKSRLP